MQPGSDGPDIQPTGEDRQDGSTSDLPKNGAPDVANPLDASMLRDQPCKAVTDQQAEKLPGKLSDTATRKDGCVWSYDGDLFRLGAINGDLEVDNPEGLSSYYGDFDDDDTKVNPVDPIKGYPAIYFDIGTQDPGNCVIKVGIRNSLVYTSHAVLDSEHPSYDEPCEVAREFTEIAIENLKEAQ